MVRRRWEEKRKLQCVTARRVAETKQNILSGFFVGGFFVGGAAVLALETKTAVTQQSGDDVFARLYGIVCKLRMYIHICVHT